jgi:hypothetical protein
VSYDWSGVRARRVTVLKVCIVLFLCLAALSYPVLILVRAFQMFGNQ